MARIFFQRNLLYNNFFFLHFFLWFKKNLQYCMLKWLNKCLYLNWAFTRFVLIIISCCIICEMFLRQIETNWPGLLETFCTNQLFFWCWMFIYLVFVLLFFYDFAYFLWIQNKLFSFILSFSRLVNSLTNVRVDR